MTKDKREGWLADLKVGDKVICERGYSKTKSVGTVEKITPTGRIRISDCSQDFNYMGVCPGDPYTPWLKKATEENIKKIERETLESTARVTVGDLYEAARRREPWAVALAVEFLPRIEAAKPKDSK